MLISHRATRVAAACGGDPTVLLADPCMQVLSARPAKTRITSNFVYYHKNTVENIQ